MLFDANRNKRESLRRGVAKAGPGRLACLVCSALVVVGARARVPKNSAHLARRSLKGADHDDQPAPTAGASYWGASPEPVAEEGADGHGHSHDHDHGHDHGSDACKADECGKAFQTVLMVHDVCKESDFPNALEAQLHLHEESCAQHFCNTADGPFELKCEDHDHDHDHDHEDHAEEESCACVAEQQGWTIDCAKPAPVSAAATYLTDNNCKDNNTTDACEMNFHIIQSHHDFCGYDDIPVEAELLVHELDPYFTHCNVRRQHDQDMPQCPAVDCKDKSAMEAAVAKLASPACAAA